MGLMNIQIWIGMSGAIMFIWGDDTPINWRIIRTARLS